MGELHMPLVRTELEQVVAGTHSGSEPQASGGATTDWLAKVCVTLGCESHVLLRPMRDRAPSDGA